MMDDGVWLEAMMDDGVWLKARLVDCVTHDTALGALMSKWAFLIGKVLWANEKALFTAPRPGRKTQAG